MVLDCLDKKIPLHELDTCNHRLMSASGCQDIVQMLLVHGAMARTWNVVTLCFCFQHTLWGLYFNVFSFGNGSGVATVVTCQKKQVNKALGFWVEHEPDGLGNMNKILQKHPDPLKWGTMINGNSLVGGQFLQGFSLMYVSLIKAGPLFPHVFFWVE